MISTIIFDWDGTLVDSLQQKYEAWFEIFPEGEEAVVVAEVLPAYVGKKGSDILTAMYSKLSKQKQPLNDFIAKHSARYQEHAFQKIITAGFMPGAVDALKELLPAYKLYINSTTPVKSLMRAVTALNVGGFFRDVLGANDDQEYLSQAEVKIENLRKIMAQAHSEPSAVLMVGDHDVDYEGAEACGCAFVGISNARNRWALQKKTFPVISDLRDVKKLLMQYGA